MSFLHSVLFGSKGSYNILGTQVTFADELSGQNDFSRRGFSNTPDVNSQMPAKIAACITLVYFEPFVHEMGHALAHKVLTGHNSEVHISFQNLTGCHRSFSNMSSVSSWKRTIMDIAGPMGHIALSTCSLIAATALKSYLSWPVAIVLGARAVFYIADGLCCAIPASSIAA